MKKWRPFWSYRIEETEQWLSDMANKGQHVTRLNYLSQFEFEEGTPKKQTYAIDLRSNASRLLKAGWQRTTSLGNWTIYEAEQAHIFPSRENVFKRLRTHYYTLIFVLALITPLLIVPLLLMAVSSSNNFLFDISILFLMTFGSVYAVGIFLFMKFRKKENDCWLVL